MRAQLKTFGVAAVAALALAPAATAVAAPMPEHSPVPVLDGDPFPLPGLAPSVTTLVRGIPIPPNTAVADLMPRVVVDTGDPRLVVRRIDPITGAALGTDAVVSDAASVPAGPGAAVATGYVRAVPVTVPAATPPLPGQPAPPATPWPEQPSGDWLVAWVASDPAGVRLVGRRVDDDGMPVGASFPLSETTYDEIDDVAVSVVETSRRALVVWSGARAIDAGHAQVVTQGWEPDAGLVAPSAARISSAAGAALGSLSVDYNVFASARHLVVWRGTDPAVVGDPLEQEVLGRVLAEGGAPAGDVLRLSHVGLDGDPTARPVGAAVGPSYQRPPAGAWAVAWSQAPVGDAALRVLDADGHGPDPKTVTASGATVGEAIGQVAVSAFDDGGRALAYDVGPALGPRRVALQQLQADGTQTGAPLALSAPGQDARAPLFAELGYVCRQLAVWRSGSGADAIGRYLWEPGCEFPRPGVATPLPGRPAPPPLPPRRARPRVYGKLALRSLRFAPRRLTAGRSAWLRLRVTAPATVVVKVERGVRGRSARNGRRLPRLPRLRAGAATLRRVLVREPQTVAVRVRARDGRGRALAPGRYRLVVTATSPQRKRAIVRVPFRVVRR